MLERCKEGNETELDILPRDWEIKTLGECLERIVGGGTPLRSNPKYWGNEIPWATVKDVTNHNPEATQEYITKEGLAYSSSNLIPPGTLILSTRMALGKAVIFNIEVSINQDLKALFNKSFLDKKYFYYWLQGNGNIMKELGNGSTVMGMSLEDLRRIKIMCPTNKNEQKAIANALSDTDILISSLEKLIAKKRAIKQGAIQEFFKPKKIWKKSLLSSCLKEEPDYGINAPAVHFNGSLPVYLRITDITNDGKYSTNSIVSVNDPRSRDFLLEKGDMVFARTGASVGKTYLYNPKDGKLVFAGFLIRIKSDPDILLPEYLFYFTQTYFYRNWVQVNSLRTGQPGINSNEYKTLPVLLPSIDEQKGISQLLMDMDLEIESLEKKLNKYKLIKQGMMQELLTGKTRLV